MALDIDFVNFISWFEGIGGFDIILPFILIFAIVFAIMDKINLLGKRNIHTIISIIVASFLVIQRDAVLIIQNFLPRISMLILGLIMILLVLGIFGQGFGTSWQGLSIVVAIAGIIWALGASIGWDVPAFDYFTDQDVAILLMVGVFALVIWFIVREPKDPQKGGGDSKLLEFLKNLTGDVDNKKGS
jgi:hypothetical protein